MPSTVVPARTLVAVQRHSSSSAQPQAIAGLPRRRFDRGNQAGGMSMATKSAVPANRSGLIVAVLDKIAVLSAALGQDLISALEQALIERALSGSWL